MEPESLSLRAVKYTNFDTAFTPMVDSDEATELSLLLSTLCRSLSQCGTALGSGEWQSLLTWQPGSALKLDREIEGYCCEQWGHFSGWEDAPGPDLRLALEASAYLGLRTPELMRTVYRLPSVRWAGIRCSETSSWVESVQDKGLSHDGIRQAAKCILQAEVLLKENKLPHKRLQVEYTGGTFWSWTNAEDDDFMVLTDANAGLAMQATLIRCGEAFALPDIT